jgi:hypothetical protein
MLSQSQTNLIYRDIQELWITSGDGFKAYYSSAKTNCIANLKKICPVSNDDH